MKIVTNDNSTLEVITTDSYTGEGTEDITISVYNKICKDSAHINLTITEATDLRNELNEWLQDCF